MGILRTDKISGLETPTPVTGSVVFDGSGDYLQITPDEDFAFGNSDFTIETWAYFDTVSASSGQIYEGRPSSTQGAYVSLYFSADNTFSFYTDSAVKISGTVIASRWYHIALVRNSGTTTLYLDGISQGTYSDSQSYVVRTDGPIIGVSRSGSGNPLDGYLSNYRILKGTALYTSDFTPPTHALEVIGDTILLCCNNSDSAGADGTGKTVTANGNAAASTVSPGLTRDFTGGTEFQGVTVFDTQGYFVPPSGTTEQRGRGRGVLSGGYDGSGRVNSIFYITIHSSGNSSEFGDLTQTLSLAGSSASSTRALISGGFNPSASPSTAVNTIDFVTIAATGNAVNFGDLTRNSRSGNSCSSSTRGLHGGGITPVISDIIDFVTIASLGDATDFGDLSAARSSLASTSSPTRGVFAGGQEPTSVNTIEYVTIASTGDALDFGDQTVTRPQAQGLSSPTRGVFAGGEIPSDTVVTIDYITFSSIGNAQDFGDLVAKREMQGSGASNSIRGVFIGGRTPSTEYNTMEYITISSTGNTKDFGDLSSTRSQIACTSDSHGGLS